MLTMPLTIFSYASTYRLFQIKVCPKESRNRVISLIFKETPGSEHTQSTLDYV